MSKPGERNRLNEDHGRKQSSSKLVLFFLFLQPSSRLRSVAGIYATIPVLAFTGVTPFTQVMQLEHFVGIKVLERTVFTVASRKLSLSLACRFRFGERHGQSSRLRLGREAEPPLEKLQVDHRPGAEEGLPQTVSLRWADFQHACKCAAAQRLQQ